MDIVNVLTQLGFPAVVALLLLRWMLGSLNGKLDDLRRSLEEVRDALQDMVEALNASRFTHKE